MKKKASRSARQAMEHTEAFAQEYMLTFNATQAYIDSYCQGVENPDRKNATRQAYQVMQRPDVKARIIELKKERSEKWEFDHEKVLREFAKVAFVNVADLYNPDGTMKDITELDRTLLDAVQSIKKTTLNLRDGDTKEIIEIKMHDKLRALDSIAKHVGFYQEDNKRDITVRAAEVDYSKLSTETLRELAEATGDTETRPE